MRVILEMANNHQGSVDRGVSMIESFVPLIAEFPIVELCWKFQYRSPSILHPALESGLTQRIRSTMLDDHDKYKLRIVAANRGFKIGCTPFDEESADLVKSHGYDFCKVASCSLTDWPLLERVATLDLPVIASTGGATRHDVIQASQFLKRRVPQLTLMHCVSEYPTKTTDLRLDRIDWLNRLPTGVTAPAGYSTHEEPDADIGCVLALAKGCRTFEWHVCLPDPGPTVHRPNGYSLTVEETRFRLRSLVAFEESLNDKPSSEAEQDSLRKLRRGAFAARSIKPGEIVGTKDVMFQIPAQQDQWVANNFGKYKRVIAAHGIEKGEQINATYLDWTESRCKIQEIADKVQAVLLLSGAVVPRPTKLVLSHHYGLDRFEQVGCGQVECVVEGQYAKKLLIVLSGQRHPEHWHAKKTETFNVLYGTLEVSGTIGKLLTVGQQMTLSPEMRHGFYSPKGCVFEEISTACEPDDSFYTEPVDKERKTAVWLP